MSKANVAQEPSMDEILASIRRIIETGEDRGAAGGFRDGATRDASLDAIRKEAEDAEASDGSSLSYFQRPVAEPIASEVPSYGTVAPTASFQEHGGENRGGGFGVDEDHLTVQLETELAATWGEFEQTHHATAALNGYEDGAHVASVTQAVTGSVGEPIGSDEHVQTDSREETTMSETARHQAPTDRTSFEPANTDRRGLEEQGAYGTYATAGVDPLLSQSSGQMVAASFDELAQAIRNGELKSLEAMAQEMLKPMLAEWLDDNLPRMVERLVREEIERLSRGGRR
ncbi:hypothetical protein M673_11990 [Aureimonas sp. AU20]|nr:hypothetical protein M673_11990 [Aureimonas sp. AU20]